jgi:hypothetical protein
VVTRDVVQSMRSTVVSWPPAATNSWLSRELESEAFSRAMADDWSVMAARTKASETAEAKRGRDQGDRT